MAEQKPGTAAEPQNNPADNIPASQTKKPASQKDPSVPTLVPFQLISLKNRERLAAIGKANDSTLSVLLDAYEKRSDMPAKPADNSGKLQQEIEKLQQQIAEQKQTIAEQEQKITATTTANTENTNAEIQRLQTELTAKQKKIADNADKISDLQNQMAEKDRMLKELDKLTKNQANISELKDRAGALEEEVRQNKKVIEAAADQKKAYDNKIKLLESDIKNLKEQNKRLQTAADSAVISQYTAPDDFLKAFQPIVANLLVRTADKLTSMRTDDIEVTPSLILGDMFLKYSVQKRTLWFWPWLSDAEIVEAAQEVNPNITSVRMLRRVLNIDKELI